MKTLLLEFREDGSVALLSETVEGFQAVVQAALVNLLSESGSDQVYEARGTALLAGLVGGGVYDLRSAGHAANFAAADTLFFVRETCEALESDKLEDLKLFPEVSASRGLLLVASFVSADERVLGRPIYNSKTTNL